MALIFLPVFAILLGGVLALGTGLLASTTFSEGALLGARTAAQLIGWALLLSPLVAASRLRRQAAEIGAAAVAFSTGLAVLYVAYFEWGGTTPSFPEAHAAEIVPAAAAVTALMPVAVTLPPVPEPALTMKRAAVLAPAPASEYRRSAIPESPPY